MRNISKIMIHCSASPDSLDFGVKDIEAWHKERGFKSKSGISCGYHYVIKRNGVVQRGRPDSETGAHVKGHNRGSLGICLIGDKDFTQKQIISLYAITRGLMHQYNVDIENVLGHYELFPGKTCPNLKMDIVRANLIFNQEVELKDILIT